MRNIRLEITYDGTAYRGWQVQPEGATIQGRLEEALERITGEKVSLIGASRTDAGVHAILQVANFKTRSKIPLDAFSKGVNSLIPDDITVKRAEDVSEGFDARRDATSKRYRYRIVNSSVRDPLERIYSFFVPERLSVRAMVDASFYLMGTHDFTSFRAAGSSIEESIREIVDIVINKVDDAIKVEIEGTGFLRHMVRNIVGTLIEIGRGRMPVQAITSILESRNREMAGPTAPPQGLFLVLVRY